MKQTVTTRYRIGEPVALSDTSLQMYHGFDQALKRDVWVEVYPLKSEAEKIDKQVIYNRIREQIIGMNDSFRNVFDVYDDEDHVYVVGESLRTFVPLIRFLKRQDIAEPERLVCLLKVLAMIIKYSANTRFLFPITADRIFVNHDVAIKLVPKYENSASGNFDLKYQAYEILNQVAEAIEFHSMYQGKIRNWLHHAEKHGNIIDQVDVQLWMEEINQVHSVSAEEDKQFPDRQGASSSKHTQKSRRNELRHSNAGFSFPDILEHPLQGELRKKKMLILFRKQPIWLRLAFATLLLSLIGWLGYNWLNPSITVPELRGKSYFEAISILHQMGINDSKIERVDDYTTLQKNGYVYGQDPNPGNRMRLSSAIVLKVSKGVPEISVPNVVGMTVERGKDQLVQAGVAINRIVIQGGSAADGKSLILSQQPKANTILRAGQSITLIVAANQQSSLVTMPDLTGMSIQKASDLLLKIGLHYEYRINPSDAPKGTVYQQSVEAGQQVSKGTKVNLSVAR
ncbi:PASTA domain-containing protein [Fodinisporobacter ferrooxydans]|uniref:PASTA domain-containing protein n=1 Tax=Fodinisporobacter ferrooxydans TaxID=2901836 RepID=A0ABY4CFL8_9BACL|nr:PASTA domain-containing protein [Alicyclobacillaceae bacterium MYW30-H2]